MISSAIAFERLESALKIHHGTICLETAACMEFVDLTDQIIEEVESSGVRDGVVNIQTRHTTTAIIVNEHEPLLLEDMRRTLERLAPGHIDYRHNDFSVRTTNMEPDENQNGHSHCKAMFLHASETLNIAGGAIQLGRWQRIFLIELDGARTRTVSLTIIGERS